MQMYKDGLSLEVKPDKEIPHVFHIEKDLLTLILSNILQNAVLFNKKKGRIIVKLSSNDDMTMLRVKICDNGYGFDLK